MTTIRVALIEEAWDQLPVFYQHINDIFLSKGINYCIEEAFEPKKALVSKGTLQGVVVFFDSKPVGMGWVETVTRYYGSCVAHVLDPRAKPVLVEAMVQRGYFKDVFAEFIHFEEDIEPYQEAFMAQGLHENARQRMILHCDDYDPAINTRPFGRFECIKRDKLKVSATISYFAHQVSLDYEGYKDLSTLNNRIKLEESVFDKLYGPVIEDASLFILDDNTIVGSCLMVEIACWGEPKVPWVFDICIRPDYIGRGYGKQLLHRVLTVLKDTQEYPFIGLSVTQSNVQAIAVYEALGFTRAEFFYEYVQL